ncbi:preprotein translocase subunit YajC [Fredinandcohnia sp. 179-A 10B2 NHS]|uniref:preprotein translocase subunit YajC n=1 Tax=Fredinandcohnia sp. 179-A 10B2 NHS TaxID=3235176 RepID=UPI0039A33737
MEGILGTVGPLILMFAIFYFLLIRPQQKRQKATVQMQSNLAKGDKVVTVGGLHGIIDSIDENKVVIKSGNANLTYDKQAVRDVIKD